MTDLYQALLGMAANGRQGQSQSAVWQLLANQEGVDPTTQALLTQLAARNAEEADDDGDDEIIELERDLGRDERRRRATRLLRQRFAELQDELDELRDRNDTIAAALGACYRCWGEEPDCPVCHGHGRPGSEPPDRRLFNHYIAPALQRIRAAPPRRREPAPDPQRTEEGA